MATKSNGSTKTRNRRRQDMLNSVKREATAPRLAAAAGVLALGVAAGAVWRKAEWRDSIRSFGQSMRDRLSDTAEQVASQAKAMGSASSDERKAREPLAAVA